MKSTYCMSQEEMAELRARPFPVQRTYQRPSPGVHCLAVESVPWHVAERAYLEYARRYGGGRTLERIAQRGGFGESELDSMYPDWRTADSTPSWTWTTNKTLDKPRVSW